MPKKPKDFKITGETGITIKEEPLFDMPAESRMTACVLETHDYGNEKRLTLEFERHNSESVFDKHRDMIGFYRMQEVKEIIENLRNLANRLQTACVDEIKE